MYESYLSQRFEIAEDPSCVDQNSGHIRDCVVVIRGLQHLVQGGALGSEAMSTGIQHSGVTEHFDPLNRWE